MQCTEKPASQRAKSEACYALVFFFFGYYISISITMNLERTKRGFVDWQVQ